MRIVRYSAQILKGSGQQTGAFFICAAGYVSLRLFNESDTCFRHIGIGIGARQPV